jgi:CHASE2 domain-containing sensor protein
MEFSGGYATTLALIVAAIAGGLLLLVWSTRDPRRRPLSWLIALLTVGGIAMVVFMLAGPAAFLLFELA